MISPDVKKLIPKLIALSAPLLLLIGVYCLLDPFKVVHSYTNYYPDNNNFVTINKDYVGVEIIKKQLNKYKYDSFIFGSSRSMFFEAKSWKKYISSDKIFHFDASGESLHGLSAKIRFMENENIPIKNAVIVLDVEVLKKIDDYPDYLYIKHPLLTGSSWLYFHYKHFESFSTFKFIKSYLDYYATHTYKPYMKDFIMNKRAMIYDSIKNEFYFKEIEGWIEKDPKGYYTYMKDVFYVRDSIQKTDSQVIVNETQMQMLNSIKDVLSRNRTNYKLIISPLYNEIKMNPKDIIILKTIFDSKNVFDFSGKSEITKVQSNYYENSHYRPNVAKLLLDSIYQLGSLSAQ